MGDIKTLDIIKGKIEAVGKPGLFQNVMQLGFKLGGKWYNIEAEEGTLKAFMETSIKRGNEIEFQAEKNIVKQVIRFDAVKEEKEKEEGWEDEIVNFESLLNAAHKKNENFSIETEMLTIDMEKSYALFKAVITVNKDEREIKRFEAHGDTTDKNISGEYIKPHFIRMAETRAICRALRWYTNNATCSEEEKGNAKPSQDKPKTEVKTEKVEAKKEVETKKK